MKSPGFALLLPWLSAVALAQSAPAPAAKGKAALPKLVERLPADTNVYVHLAGFDRLANELKTLAPYRIWQEEEVQAFWDSLKSRLGGNQLPGNVGQLLGMLDTLRLGIGGAVSVVLTGGPEGPPHYAVVFEGCRTQEGTEALLDGAHHGMLGFVLKGKPKIEMVGELKLRSYAHPTLDLLAATQGTTFAIGNDRDLLARVCASKPPDAASLAQNEAFKRSWAAAAGGDPTLFMFANTGSLIDALSDREKEEAAQMGVSGMRGVSLSLCVQDDEALDRVYLDMPEGRKSFLLGLSAGPTKARAAAIAPATSLAMVCAPIDPVALYQALQNLEVQRAGDFGFIKEIEKSLVDSVKLRLHDDLLMPLGKEITFFVILPGTGAIFPEFAAAVEVRNEGAMDENLNSVLTKTLGQKLEEMKFSGRVIRRWREAERGGFLEMGINPAYTVSGGYLILGSGPNAIKRVLQAMDGKAPSIAKDPTWQKALERTMADGAPSGLLYFNTKRTFEYLHGIVTPLMNMFARGNDLPFDPATLPTAESVSKHLSVAVNALRLPKEAVEVRSFSDGLSLSMLIMAGAAVGVAMETWDQAQRIDWQARYEMERLYHLVERHQKEKHALPGKLADAAKEGEREIGEEAERYCYFPEEAGTGDLEQLPKDAILFWVKEKGERGCRFYLTAAGGTDWLPEDQFQERLKAQTGRFKK